MFSSSSRDQGTDPNSVESSAKVNRLKVLISTALGALVVLGCIGGAIWYNSGSPVVPESVTNPPHNAGGSVVMGTGGGLEVGGGNSGGVESAGASAGSQRVSSAPQASPSSRRLMTAAKANFKLVVGVLIGVFVLLAAIVALVVYLSSSNQELVNVDGNVEDADDPLKGGNSNVTEEEEEGVPVLPIILSVAAVALVTVSISWQAYQSFKRKETAKEKPRSSTLRESLMKLQEFRNKMPLESRCDVNENENRPYEVLIKYGDNSQTVHCPENFTLNSVWWALDLAEKSEILISLEHDRFSIESATSIFNITRQYQKVRNIPDNKGVPFFPENCVSTNTDVNVFNHEYANWHNWAILDTECNISESESMNVAVSVKIDGAKLPVTIYCSKAKPTIKSVYSALSRDGKLNYGKYFSFYRVGENFESMQLLANDLGVSNSRYYLWKMYEAMSLVPLD